MYRVRIAIGTLLLSLIGTVLWFDLRMETDIGTLLVLGLVVLGSFDEFLCMFKVRRGFRVLGALLAMTSLLGIWGVRTCSIRGLVTSGGSVFRDILSFVLVDA